MKFVYLTFNQYSVITGSGMEFFSETELLALVGSIIGTITGLEEPVLSIIDSKITYKKLYENQAGLNTILKSGWYNSNGEYLGKFLTVEGLTFNEVKSLMPLEAPFFQAFWSDYNLFRDEIRAYEYGVEYVDHWNEELNSCFANKPYLFEKYSEREGFDLVWETRRGNYLYYSLIKGRYMEKYDEEGSEIEGEYFPEETKVCIELSSSIAWGLFQTLNERDSLEGLTFSSEKYVPWEENS